MEDIRFYNEQFELLFIEPDFISSNWQVYYNAVGQFEAHFPLDSELVSVAMETPFLVAVQGKNAAVITGKRISEDFALFGRTCNWLLTKRVVPAFEAKAGTAAELVCGLAQDAFSDMENFTCEVCGEFTKQISVEKEDYSPLSEIVTECLNSVNAGHELVFDVKQKRWIFRVYCGKELELVISEDNRNAVSGEICEDVLDVCSAGWYRQKQETEDRQKLVWTRVGSADAAGVFCWECVLSSQTEEDAVRELSQKKKKLSMAAESLGVCCHTDYELGDVVRVQIKKGTLEYTGKKRIVAVHRWYEEGEVGEQPIMEGYDELQI